MANGPVLARQLNHRLHYDNYPGLGEKNETRQTAMVATAKQLETKISRKLAELKGLLISKELDSSRRRGMLQARRHIQPMKENKRVQITAGR